MKRMSKRMKALYANLRYYQMQVRIDTRNFRLSLKKVREIAKEMRQIQKEGG